MRFTGKAVVVTGGANGLGRAALARMIAEGARVATMDRDAKALSDLKAQFADEVLTVEGDTRNLSDLDRLYAEVKSSWGPIDSMVANAALERLVPLDEVTPEEFDERIAGVLKGTYFSVQRAVPYFARSASVVLVGSAAANQGLPGNTLYAACKAAIRSLARNMSADLLSRGIRVNCLSPGLSATPMVADAAAGRTDAEAESKVFAQIIDKQIPLKRMAEPEEIAAGIAFLASSDSSYMLGSDLVMDGGMVQM